MYLTASKTGSSILVYFYEFCYHSHHTNLFKYQTILLTVKIQGQINVGYTSNYSLYIKYSFLATTDVNESFVISIIRITIVIKFIYDFHD